VVPVSVSMYLVVSSVYGLGVSNTVRIMIRMIIPKISPVYLSF
jgi:hypothetical protein